MAMDMIRYGGLLFLVSLTGIWAAVVQLDPATKVLLHRNARSASCVVDGNTYADGSTFTITGSASCTTYTCNNGNTNMIAFMCRLFGQCVAVNSTLDANCDTYTCTSTTNNGYTQLHIAPSTSRCSYENQCVDNGGTVVTDCTTRTCNVQTVSNGTTFKSMTITSVRCSYENQCVDNGGTVVTDCTTRTCNVQTVSNGTTFKSMTITSVQCQDVNGACHASGQRVTRNFPNYGTLSCLCTVNDKSISYTACSAT